MTESSEQATAQRQPDSHLRMHVAMTEGYHGHHGTGASSVCDSGAEARQYSQQEHEEDKSAAVASSRIFHSDGGEMEPETMEIKSVSEYFTKMHMGPVMSRQRGKQRDLEPRDTCESSDVSHSTTQDSPREETPHLVGKYHAFTVRDAYYMNQIDLGRTHLKDKQPTWQPAPGNKMAENLSPDCGNDSQASHADRMTIKGDKQDLVGKSQQINVPSPSKGPVPAECATSKENDKDKMASSEQEVARLYDYHVNKRMSSLQSEGIHSLQSSQCSSIDAGCSTGSSSCVTPMDSPLCTTENIHVLSGSSLKGLTYAVGEDKTYPSPFKAGHPMDPTLLRKIHAATSAEPGFTITRDSAHRIKAPKIKETTV